MQIPGYRLVSELAREPGYVLYRGERLDDTRPVLLKVCAAAVHGAAAEGALRREQAFLGAVRVDGLPAVLALETSDGTAALVLDDAGGVPASALVAAGPLPVGLALSVGCSLAAQLQALHDRGVVHRQVSPHACLVDPDAGRARLIDFALASRIAEETQPLVPPSALPGRLAYVSPEQTGRMNRALDHRTDFYSLGATLYHLLTGTRPFESEDPLELVHWHIARQPVPPDERHRHVPQAVSRVVMRLLAKTAEHRYQSASGVLADLRACLDAHGRGEVLSDFVPGTRDVTDRFTLPQGLYGREAESAALLDAFDEACGGGGVLMLVAGYSGVGKSALVQEVHKPILARRGRFHAGKFDQLDRTVPYGAFIDALRGLVREILAGTETEVAETAARLREAVGANGGVLEAVVPEITSLIGPQPSLPPLGPAESQNRFGYVFRSFFAALARPEHPLVVFLDDLQWADAGTLGLFATLLAPPAVGHLLVIGAYRDNEVGADHPLSRLAADLRRDGARVRSLRVPPLSVSHVHRLVADTVGSHDPDVAALATTVHAKTGGNAFFVRRVLRSLHDAGGIRFDRSAGRWRVDLERVREAEVTENVIDLMTRELGRLPEVTRHVVTLAACIGNAFALSNLATVCARGRRDVERDLWPAVEAGLVVPLANGYDLVDAAAGADDGTDPSFRFLHDRVQQAAYARIPVAERSPVHLRVGRLLLARAGGDVPPSDLFEVVNHLNRGAALILDPVERDHLARLDLAAGRRAKASAAFPAALAYFDAGCALLGDDDWEARYELMLPLAMEQAEAAYLCGQFDRAERGVDALIRRAHDPAARADAYRMRIVQCENLARYHDAVAAGREALALFGIALPEDSEAVEAALQREFAAIDARLGATPVSALVDLPAHPDPAIRSVLALLTAIWAPAYVASLGATTGLISALIVRLSLEHGNTEDSAYGYVTHAISVGVRQGDPRRGHEFGRLALAVNERFADVKRRAKVHHMFSCFVNLWCEPLATCLPHAREAHRWGVETGDFTYASYAIFHESWYAFLSGTELTAFETHYAANVEFLRRIRNDSFADAQLLILQWARAFRLAVPAAPSLSGGDFDEAAYEAGYGANPFFRVFLETIRLHVAVFFGDVGQALEAARAARAVISSLTGTIWTVLLEHYEGLALASACHALDDGADRQAARGRLGACAEAVERAAASAPANFERHALLLAAEIAAVDGAGDRAVNAFDVAIRAAAASGARQDEALACERCAEYWRRRGHEGVALPLLARAHVAYASWGAAAKVEDLERRFPKLAAMRGAPARGAGDASASGLDIATVMKASHAIASEMDLDRLVATLLRIAIENAGAGRGTLVEDRGGDLLVIAQQDVRAATPVPAGGVPLADWPGLVHGVVRLAHRTGEPLIIDDARADTRWFGDPYVTVAQPLSILALPILRHGERLAVIYLENDLTTGAFTPARVAIMRALAGQAAISLVNARLLQEKNAEIARRTGAEAALRDALAELRALKDQLQAENLYLQEELRAGHDFEEVVGRSPALLTTLRHAERVAATASTVLITGETGTGKESVARAIHGRSSRADRPLVKVNCGAIPSGLVESELFGHVKGAFTGALQKRVGRFELAHRGSIFLDEVGELPLDTQVKLLRVLQEQEFEPVGATRSVRVDVRVIAATNRDLEAMVRAGTFRADLFYRLNVFPLRVPPLRERREDIPLLVAYFLSKLSKALGKPLEGLTARSMDRLLAYDWPGNVRELQNVVERAAILAHGPVVDLERDRLPPGAEELAPAPPGQTLEEVEKQHILRIVRETNWIIEGQKGAATLLGLHPNTLRSRMKKLGIARAPRGMS